MQSASGDEEEDEFQITAVSQPFDVRIDERERVQLNTGALQYTESLVTIPGVNGNDIDLRVEYNSADSYLDQYGYCVPGSEVFYRCTYTSVVYVTGWNGEEVRVEERADASEHYTEMDQAMECIGALEEREGETVVLNPPYVDEVQHREVLSNTRTIRWVENPYLVLESTQSNPNIPQESYTFSSQGYSGELFKTGTSEVSGTEAAADGTYSDGRTIWKRTWVEETAFEGTIRATFYVGNATFLNVAIETANNTVFYGRDKTQTYNEKRYNIGAGWSFNIPSIENWITDRLVLPDKGSYTIYGNDIDGYLLKDMALSMDQTYSNGQFDAYKKLSFADGTAYYFNAEGLLIAEVDRFGNTVTYKYAQVEDEWRPSEIIDTAGRSTTITYAETATGKTVTVTAPDGSETVLHIRALESEDYGENNYVLDKIVYPDGETTSFRYALSEGTYSFSYTSGGDGICYALLEAVEYDTGAQLRYAYALRDVELRARRWQGHLNIYRLTERYALENAADNRIEGYTAYTYTDDYSMGKSYSTKVSRRMPNGETVSDKYTFSSKHLCTQQETYDGNTLKQRVSTSYDTYELPSGITTTRYGTTFMAVTETYTHDEYGNTLTYTPPKGYANPSSTEYRTTYTYDGTYQLPLSVEYRQDSRTTVKITNTLTEDKKNIAETCVYTKGVLQSRTAYTYDSAGRVLTKSEYPSVNVTNAAGITTSYTYSGANLASQTITGMQDAEGFAIANLAQSYTYDTMGRVVTATDGNGNVTATGYDNRGRVTMVTKPDESVTAYAYDTGANTTVVTESGREAVVYDYDGLGRLQAVYYASGDLQKEYYYDEQGRVTAEATGRGSSAASTVYYTYDLFDRVIEKAVYDRTNSVVYRETSEYDDAYTRKLLRVTKTIEGDAYAEAVVTITDINESGEIVREETGGAATKYEYDYVGNLVRSYYTIPVEDEIPEDDIVPEDVVVTTGSYTYDYRGNVLTETHDGYNKRICTYDGLGRKVSERDYRGNVTTYAYDNAGRLIWTVAPVSEAASAITRYFYDGNGNTVKKKWLTQADTDEVPVMRRIEYSYDSMNRLTDIAQEISTGKTEYTHYAYNAAGDRTDMYTGLSASWQAALDSSGVQPYAVRL